MPKRSRREAPTTISPSVLIVRNHLTAAVGAEASFCATRPRLPTPPDPSGTGTGRVIGCRRECHPLRFEHPRAGRLWAGRALVGQGSHLAFRDGGPLGKRGLVSTLVSAV